VAKNSLIVSDGGMRRVFRTAVEKSTFTAEDLVGLEELSGFRMEDSAAYPVQDLDAVRYCPGLKSFDLTYNEVEDLGPLAGCPELEELNLLENLVTDLTPLRHCSKLRVLNLNSNSDLVDIEPLRGLKSLEQLDLNYTAVEDFSPLLDLPALKEAILPVSNLDWESEGETVRILSELARRGVALNICERKDWDQYDRQRCSRECEGHEQIRGILKRGNQAGQE